MDALLSQYLTAYAEGESPSQTTAEPLAFSRQARGWRGGARWTRDDLHDR